MRVYLSAEEISDTTNNQERFRYSMAMNDDTIRTLQSVRQRLDTIGVRL